MGPWRVREVRARFKLQKALRRATHLAGTTCHMLPNGPVVRIDAGTAYEPDAIVHCGPRLDPEAIEVPTPLLLAEVLSPGTGSIDSGAKLADYFGLPSVHHYLLVDAVKRVVIHHRRGDNDLIETRIVREGALRLDPPGLDLDLADLFPGQAPA